MTSHRLHPYTHPGVRRNTGSLTPTRASVPDAFYTVVTGECEAG